MRLLSILILGAAALATPALALTVTAAPNRDQAQHLKQERSPSGGVDLRDSLAGGGRPLAGSSFSSTSGNTQTQTYSFGNVTTTITTGREDLRTRPLGPVYGDPLLRRPDFAPRRRD